MILRLDSLRRPEFLAFATGTRRVMRSLSNRIVITCRLWPEITCVSIPNTLPTP
jgi:hypothetical protein